MILRLTGVLLVGALCAANIMSTHAGGATAVKVYVAASAKDVVENLAAQFQRETGVPVEVSPGPSSKLAKQIVDGAPADLFLSADQVNADYLETRRLLARRHPLLGNRLVVVTSADSAISMTTLADLGRDEVREVAVAFEKVPAGEYARQALRAADVWERVRERVIGGDDVRATLAFVERGAAAGIVYRTDTINNSKVRVAFEIPPALHAPIVYPLLLLKREAMNPHAVRLYDYLTSAPAAEVVQRAGWQVLDGEE